MEPITLFSQAFLLFGFGFIVFGLIPRRSGNESLCPACEYDLKSLRPGGKPVDELRKADLSFVCPECGHESKWGRVAIGPVQRNMYALSIGGCLLLVWILLTAVF